MRKTKGKINKYLIKPIPAVYNEGYKNPLLNDVSYIPILTNSAGLVTFNDLSFSVEGPAGNYRLKFYCDGVSIETSDIKVKTIVRKIKFHV